jgi:signal transduction histidine kinase/CheY-like chemotaxis protein
VKKAIRELYERYRSHHEGGSPLLEWIGVVGFFAFPLFYLLRKSSAMPVLYDDLHLRVVASSLCLLMALRRFWPRKLSRFYLSFSYFTIFFCLSFLLSFTMLKNQGGTPSVVNMLMGAVIITLLTDWRNTVVILLAGYVSSLVAFEATGEVFKVPAAFIITAAGTMLVVVAGALSHTAQKRAELERMRRVYSALAGSIAHELRTPLMQVRQSLETVDEFTRRQCQTSGFALELGEVSQAVARGRVAVNRGFQAISLTLEQLSARELDQSSFATLSAAACVRAAVDEFAYESPDQRQLVSVEVIKDFSFQGDEAAFCLVIFNLLKNALYYLPARPQLRLTIRIERSDSPRIVVRDTGPGIAPEFVARLFGEFESTGKRDGTGLGLSFCRRAMCAFGGDITCQSEHGSFTAFTLRFPNAALAPAPAMRTVVKEVPSDSPVVFQGQTVLIVDDSDFNRSIARTRLALFGIKTLEARHGQEALQMIDSGLQPEAILMDLEMPVMGGAETTRYLRQRPSPFNQIPVLGVSANDLPANRDAALAAGMNGFLSKPLDPDALRAELARLLEVR